MNECCILENLNQCNSIKPVQDECRRFCECVNGKMVNCYRLRQQFSALSLSQRNHYIEVYKETATNERFQAYFYKLIIVHPTVNFMKVHSNAELLPFHRK